MTELWYEFDDSLVTAHQNLREVCDHNLVQVRQVDLATVLASEAYVLFYRKASEGGYRVCNVHIINLAGV